MAQPEKAPSSIPIRPEGREIQESAPQSRKASFPTYRRLLGRVTDRRLPQPAKAPSWREVMPSSMRTERISSSRSAQGISPKSISPVPETVRVPPSRDQEKLVSAKPERGSSPNSSRAQRAMQPSRLKHICIPPEKGRTLKRGPAGLFFIVLP